MNTPETTATSLMLTPPKPVAALEPAEAASKIAVKEGMLPQLNAMVSQFSQNVTTLDPHSPEFAAKSKAIQQMGSSEIRASSQVSNTLLAKPMMGMAKEDGAGQKVSAGLVDLRHELEDLDPSKNSALHGLISKLPFINPVRRYFHRYQSAATQIDKITKSLENGRDELLRDNASVDSERANLWATMEKLKQYIYVADQLDTELEAKINEVAATDPDRAQELRNDLLFALRQKRQDLMTHLAVSVQGYMALGIIKDNNNELVKGVERATTTTVSALRTAVIVSQALTGQKMVLKQITALNETTDSLIASTSAQLRQQTGDIYAAAASSGVSMETLKQAFQDVFATMDAIDTYKSQAVVSMQQTVDALKVEVEKADPYLKKSAKNDDSARDLVISN